MKDKMSISCSTCKEIFQSTDDIYATNCGHIFHFDCMNEFKKRSTTCPECEHFNPSAHKMHLSFDEGKDAISANNWNDKLKILELLELIEENQNDYLHLQEKFEFSQKSVQKLEGRMRKADNSMAQRSFSDLEDRIKTLEELNEYLAIDNECKSEALILKSKEITKLINELISKGKSDKTSTSASTDQIKHLEQTLKPHTIQLNRETENCNTFLKEKKELHEPIDLLTVKSDVDEEAIKSNSTNELYKKEDCISKSKPQFYDKHFATEEFTETKLIPKTQEIFKKNTDEECIGESRDQPPANETSHNSQIQLTKLRKIKLYFAKLRDKCVKCSSIFIFVFLMSSVTAVYWNHRETFFDI